MPTTSPVRVLLIGLCSACAGQGAPAALPEVADDALRPPEAFAELPQRTRSVALFLEMHRVLVHPRCINCHPSGDTPHQGPELALHEPPVSRGPDDHGVVGMECGSCHQDRNQELARVPGAPHWGLAPLEMAWVGRSAAEICEQMKDPARNGGKSLAQLVEHNAHDELVGWGWAPGADREPAPGSQEQFGALSQAWVDSGAHCPEPQEPR